ncbi:unnamed protein product, partial [Lymnaea stagnalis]
DGRHHVTHSGQENGRSSDAHAGENGTRSDVNNNNKHQLSSNVAGSDAAPSFLQKAFSWRGAIVVLLHTSFIINVLPRNTLPMALVCMVDPYKASRGSGNVTFSNSSHDDRPTLISQNDTGVEVVQYEFDWDSELQGLILTGIQFVSFTGPILSNIVKNLIGSKNCMTAFTLTGAIFSIISPAAARVSPYFLLAVRVVSGLTLGGNVPMVGEALAWWTPDSEKLTWVACSFAG